MSVVETGQMSAAETAHVSAVEAGQMFTVATVLGHVCPGQQEPGTINVEASIRIPI